MLDVQMLEEVTGYVVAHLVLTHAVTSALAYPCRQWDGRTWWSVFGCCCQRCKGREAGIAQQWGQGIVTWSRLVRCPAWETRESCSPLPFGCRVVNGVLAQWAQRCVVPAHECQLGCRLGDCGDRCRMADAQASNEA